MCNICLLPFKLATKGLKVNFIKGLTQLALLFLYCDILFHKLISFLVNGWMTYLERLSKYLGEEILSDELQTFFDTIVNMFTTSEEVKDLRKNIAELER